MSECVVRMEMPKDCLDCPCANGEYGYCQADEEVRQIEGPNERPSWCPILCQLPEGHGRLVDADAIRLPKGFFENVDNVPKFYEWMNGLPTIVPAGGNA